ncbi:hypothetical protein CR513_61130, partial [Mucuna pruriens]
SSHEEHEVHLKLHILKKKHFCAKLSKYQFWMEEVKFLGREISRSSIFVDLGKIKAMTKWERPIIAIMILSYYRRFIKKILRLTITSVLILLNPLGTFKVLCDVSKQDLETFHYLFNQKKLNTRQRIWKKFLKDYDFKLK